MMDQSLVSVTMPAYNVGPYIGEAIESLIAQTYRNWEVVIVDDGSTDDTRNVVEAYQAREKRIKTVFLPHGGRGRARNECLRYCTGEFVALLDSDDVAMPDRFEKQVRYLQAHPDVGAVSGQCCSFWGQAVLDLNKLMRWPTSPEVIAQSFRQGKMRFLNGTSMVRAELFQRFGAYNEALIRAQDYEFFRRLSLGGVKLAALPDVLLLYRQKDLIPSLRYYQESELYKAYADYLFSGGRLPFAVTSRQLPMVIYRQYLRLKYLYLYLKLSYNYRKAQ